MNKGIVGKILGILLMLESLFLLPSLGISVYAKEYDVAIAFLITMALTLVTGLLLRFSCRKAENRIYSREGFAIVGLGWIILSMAGAIPFVITGAIPNYLDAAFEVTSGFTTTGASILDDIESLPKGLLFWRSFTNWLGGMGILVFLLAVVPMGKGAGGYSIHLLKSESPGPEAGKLVPKVRETAEILYKIYIVLTVICLIVLVVCRMPLFDSVCTTFGIAGTGGFAIKNDSIASYSEAARNACTIFMLLFGVNFGMYFLLIKGKIKDILKNQELLMYIGAFVLATSLISANSLGMFRSLRDAVHHVAFTVSSVMTTTGFSTEDFDAWPEFSRTLLLILMAMGSMAGSTGGGIKVIRVLILLKTIKARLKNALHPNSVNLVRVSGQTISQSTINLVIFFLITYFAIGICSMLLLSLDNFSMDTNLGAVTACLNNIGPGFGGCGPTSNYADFSHLSKIVLILDMLLGRLEIFPILFLIYPGTWKRIG